MQRPYIFCHMMMSLDGKIMGPYMDTPEGTAAGDVFYQIAFGEAPYYKHQGWLSGRVTTDDNFTFYKQPELDVSAAPVPEGDYVAQAQKDAGMYYISIDPSGRLGWEAKQITYIDTTAQVIEVLTEKAGNAYKAFLRKLGISYLVAGKETLDHALVLSKLKDIFGIETLMLGGGGVLNWSFIRSGMCDELSLVIAASADGSTDTPALFSAKDDLSENQPANFELQEVKRMDGGSVWLRYTMKHDEGGN